MEKRACSSSTNWAGLPTDITFTILDKLFSLEEYVRFSAVCKSWNSSALNYNNERRRLLSNHPRPWLLVHPCCICTYGAVPFYLCLYDITTSEIQKFHFNNVPSNYIPYDCFYGSSRGWLFFLEKCSSGINHALILLNPLSNTTIRLPPFTNPKFHINYTSWPPTNSVYFTLSRDPSSGPYEVLAVVFYESHNTVALLNSAVESWTYFDMGKGWSLYKFIYYRACIIGTTNLGRLVSLVVRNVVIHDDGDDSRHPSKLINFFTPKNIKTEDIAPPCNEEGEDEDDEEEYDMNKNVEAYLVESTGGDLLMIQRYYYPVREDLHKYKIYKLVIDPDGVLVARNPIVNLGGDSLFLGASHSISILASKFPAFLPNTIYRVDYGMTYSIEVFNLDNESVSKRYLSGEYYLAYNPTWIVPSTKL